MIKDHLKRERLKIYVENEEYMRSENFYIPE